MQQALHTAVAESPPDPVGTVGILDETERAEARDEDARRAAAVPWLRGQGGQRHRYRHLVVAHGPFKALLDSELFLPQSWDADRERCRQADIPDELSYRPKSDIALELLGRSERNGWRFDWLTFDEWYGSKPGFLHALDAAARRYVGEVPKSFSCRPGRSRKALSVAAVFAQPGVKKRAAKSFRLEQQTGPAAVWQAKVVDVAVGTDRRPRHRLILPRNRQTGEKKDFLTNAPRRIGLRRVLRAAFGAGMWNMVPRGQERSRPDPLRGTQLCIVETSLALCRVALAFVSLHTRQLRGEKSADHSGAGLPSPRAGPSEIPEANEPPPKRHAWKISSCTINSATQPLPNLGRNDRESLDASRRCSVSLLNGIFKTFAPF